MGGANSVDIAQAVHRSVMILLGCFDTESEIVNGALLPLKFFPDGSRLLDGIYIDDPVVALVTHIHKLHDRIGPDRDVILAGHQAYKTSCLARSVDKGVGFSRCTGPSDFTFTAASKFTAWGTAVDSVSSVAATPVDRRFRVFVLICFVATVKYASKNIMQRLLGLIVHPFLHRKALMCILHRVYKWVDNLPSSGVHRLPPDILDELFGCCVSLPLAKADLRIQVDSIVSCTDATPLTGGACVAEGSSKLASMLWEAAEHRGGYVRLDQINVPDLLPPAHFRPFVDPVVQELALALDWSVSRLFQHSSSRHVNIPEIGEICRAIIHMCDRSLERSRQVNFADRLASIGAWAKGRSSSYHLNGELRSVLDFPTLGAKDIANVYLDTALNPADDPSRLVPLRSRAEPRPWMESYWS